VRSLVVLLVASTASAQGFDFIRQDVSIDVTGSSPVIDLELTVKATRATSAFDFITPPAMLEAFDVDGASAMPVPHPQYPQFLQRVPLPVALSAGQTAKVHARLGGAMRCMVPGRPAACFTGPAGTILIPADYDTAWYFVNLYEEADPFEGQVRVRAPSTQTALAGHGAGTVEELGDGTKRWTYSLAVPTDSLFVATGDWASVDARGGEYTVKGFFPRTSNATAREQRAADLAAQVLPIYGRLYGDLPVREAHLITVPATFPAAGMGLLGNVFLAEYIFGDTYSYLLEQGIAHEVAHSWWGNLAQGSPDERGFLSEAVAEYSAWRALGELHGDAARTSGMRMNAVWYMYRTPAGQDVAPLSAGVERAPGYVFVTYHKGPMVLRAFEELAGAAAFTSGLKSIVDGQASVARLVFEVQRAGGPDLSGEVEQWLRAAGFPRLTVTASVDGSAVKWTLNSAGAFRWRLPVRARLADGRVLEQVVQVKPGTSDVSFSFDAAVETIEADPRWTLPREVKPAIATDVTLDGVVDGRDLLEVAVRLGGKLPDQRRVDGRYDPLFDVDSDFEVDVDDMSAVVTAALAAP
jgi:hypothetical protein